MNQLKLPLDPKCLAHNAPNKSQSSLSSDRLSNLIPKIPQNQTLNKVLKRPYPNTNMSHPKLPHFLLLSNHKCKPPLRQECIGFPQCRTLIDFPCSQCVYNKMVIFLALSGPSMRGGVGVGVGGETFASTFFALRITMRIFSFWS